MHTVKALFLTTLFCLEPVSATPPANSYIIRVEPSRRADLQVHSFITGIFGGVGDHRAVPVDEDGLLIPTEYQGKPAKTLRAIFYMPGCQMQSIRVDDLEADPRLAEFHCQQLGTVKLEGKINPSAIPLDGDSEVRVQYVAAWSNEFFGIMDGMVIMLDAGSSPIKPDGSFAIDLPGFAADPISSKVRDEGYFALSIKSGNTVARLHAEESLRATPKGDLRTLIRYPSPVTFEAVPPR